MNKVEWKVVDNTLRDGVDPFEQIAKALVAGKTVHATGVDNTKLTSWYGRMRVRYNRLLRRRLADPNDPTGGYIVWLEEENQGTQDPQEWGDTSESPDQAASVSL